MGWLSRSARASRLIPISACAGLSLPANRTSAPLASAACWATFAARGLIWITGRAGRLAASSSYWRPLT